MTADLHRIPLSTERQCQWRAYCRHIEMAAHHMNEAQRFYRDLFGKENPGLLSAGLAVSIEYDRLGDDDGA